MLCPLRYLCCHIDMRIAALIIAFTFCLPAAFAQKKGSVPPVEQTIPDKDPVVTIDNIQAGKSKKYHWHSPSALLDIDRPDKAYPDPFIDVTLNGKSILSHYKAKPPKRKAKTLNLKKGTNTLIISPSKSNKVDSFVLFMSLREKTMGYNITAQFRKGKSDTFIIIRH